MQRPTSPSKKYSNTSVRVRALAVRAFKSRLLVHTSWTGERERERAMVSPPPTSWWHANSRASGSGRNRGNRESRMDCVDG